MQLERSSSVSSVSSTVSALVQEQGRRPRISGWMLNMLSGCAYTAGRFWRPSHDDLLHWAVGEPSGATSEQIERWYLEAVQDVKRFLCSRFRLPRNDAEDVCQELYVRLMQYAVGQAIDNPKAYMI